jgi:hypothetical protein
LLSTVSLLIDALGQPDEIVRGTLEALGGTVESGSVQEHRGFLPASCRPIRDRQNHFQIAEEVRCSGAICGYLSLGFSTHLEKQGGLVEDALAHNRRSVAPGRIQLAGFPRPELVPRDGLGHAHACGRADTRHRYQVLHRNLREYRPLADLLLNGIRQKLNECETARDPAHAPVEPPCEILEAITAPALELGQEPPLLQGRLSFACP